MSLVIRGNALRLPIADESVDLCVTSPPYFALRSYRDGGEHYGGQVGSEPTPAAFLDALWAATAEMVRVTKLSGSIWVNIGDKYAGSGGHNNSGISDKSTLRGNGHVGGVGKAGPQKVKSTLRSAPDSYNQSSDGIRAKSLIGLPWRYAIGCIDQLGLILRAEVIWSKPNGLPESVTDRVRRSHEQWFHFVRQGRYFSAVDEVREQTSRSGLTWEERKAIGPVGCPDNGHSSGGPGMASNPLGKLPGSVWTIPTEPLIIPEAIQRFYNLPDHFAAFPSEIVRRIILGWSPAAVCQTCGQGRRPVVARGSTQSDRPQSIRARELALAAGLTDAHKDALLACGLGDTGRSAATQSGTGKNRSEVQALAEEARTVLGGYAREFTLAAPTITGYACDCPDTSAPSKPGVVLDPFCGTGTAVGVARILGRRAIGVDLSSDYCRLARWRLTSGHFAKAANRTNAERQGTML